MPGDGRAGLALGISRPPPMALGSGAIRRVHAPDARRFRRGPDCRHRRDGRVDGFEGAGTHLAWHAVRASCRVLWAARTRAAVRNPCVSTRNAAGLLLERLLGLRQPADSARRSGIHGIDPHLHRHEPSVHGRASADLCRGTRIPARASCARNVQAGAIRRAVRGRGDRPGRQIDLAVVLQPALAVRRVCSCDPTPDPACALGTRHGRPAGPACSLLRCSGDQLVCDPLRRHARKRAPSNGRRPGARLWDTREFPGEARVLDLDARRRVIRSPQAGAACRCTGCGRARPFISLTLRRSAPNAVPGRLDRRCRGSAPGSRPCCLFLADQRRPALPGALAPGDGNSSGVALRPPLALCRFRRATGYRAGAIPPRVWTCARGIGKGLGPPVPRCRRARRHSAPPDTDAHHTHLRR